MNEDENLNGICGICVENYNRSTRIPLKCEYCDFVACRKCCCTFILNETEPKCMNISSCNRAWTRQFINSKMTKNFINNELKKHREQLLFDQERALLPATQPLVEHQMQIEKIDDDLRLLQRSMSQIKHEIYMKQRERSNIVNHFNHEMNNPNTAQQRNNFIRACPDENCRGFLSSQWKCGLCQKWTCSQCYVVKGYERDDGEHVCDAGDVETASMILRETKSCPNCGMGIFKIEGCDQMFCTGCNTAFNWKTGRIQTNNIHNPHYFEWLRRTGGVMGGTGGARNCDVLNNCNDDRRNALRFGHQLCANFRLQITRRHSRFTEEEKNNCKENLELFETIVRRNIHLGEVEIPHYAIVNDNVRHNQELRIKYLRNQLDENQFKILLQRSDKKRQKNIETHNILQMVYNATVDIAYRIYNSVTVDPNWNMSVFEPLKEIRALVEYANECLADVAKTYDVKKLSFDEKLRLM